MSNFIKVGLSIGIFSLALASAAETPQDRVRELYREIVEMAPETKDSLTQKELNDLLEKVTNHPVAGLDFDNKYDQQPTGIGNREIGYCYGRAMAVHFAARRAGVRNDKIRKIFIAGNLRSIRVRWRFHMATLIQGEDNAWYVVDPIFPRPPINQAGVIKPGLWMEATKRVFDLGDGNDESKFYLTDTRAIMVDMSVIPASTDIEADTELLGDRLINVTFDPTTKPGFSKVSQEEIPAPYDLFTVNEEAQLAYFINFTEPNWNERPVFNFDFFRFSTVILFKQNPDEKRITILPRTYDYRCLKPEECAGRVGYFVDLVNSFQLTP